MPPKRVVIHDDSGQEVRDIAGPYKERSDITLFCEAQRGKNTEMFWNKSLISYVWNFCSKCLNVQVCHAGFMFSSLGSFSHLKISCHLLM